MGRKELLSKLKSARSWKEAGVAVQEVYKALLDSGEGGSTSETSSASKELAELRDKVLRLYETNKQLRAENKQLRAGK